MTTNSQGTQSYIPQTAPGDTSYGDLEHFADGEVDARLINFWQGRGPLYRIFSQELVLDYGGPAFTRCYWAANTESETDLEMPFPAKVAVRAALTLTSYIRVGYETGIANQFCVLREYGYTREQIMEMVIFTHLYAGVRGLGQTYRAVGDFLPAWGAPAMELELPAGWGPDPDAFKSGLDLSTREMTASDLTNLKNWYEETIGYVPESVLFGIKYHPRFLKANRAKWENAIRTLPKQFAPHLMIRQNMLSVLPDGVRESALLGKAWGMTRSEVIMNVCSSALYFGGNEQFYTASKALDDVLENWE